MRPGQELRRHFAWYAEQISDTGLRLDGQARALLAEWLGEDAGRLDGILETLASTYGTFGYESPYQPLQDLQRRWKSPDPAFTPAT